MNDIITPIINNNILTTNNPDLIVRFNRAIKHLYQYNIFKNILDLAMTKALKNELHFKLQDMEFFAMDAGNCKTFINDSGNKNYIITIKKIGGDVIIHEILHMIEQIFVFDLTNLTKLIIQEINNIPINKIYINNFTQNLFVQRLEHYPKEQHQSEIFARFFEIFACAKETAYQTMMVGNFLLQDLYEIFPYSIGMMEKIFSDSNWIKHINPDLALQSKAYLNPNATSCWSDSKIASLHVNDKPKWKKIIKSNF